jgi:hypothetical protein
VSLRIGSVLAVLVFAAAIGACSSAARSASTGLRERCTWRRMAG